MGYEHLLSIFLTTLLTAKSQFLLILKNNDLNTDMY